MSNFELRLRGEATVAKMDGDPFCRLNPEFVRKVADEIEQLRADREVDRRCALYWWREYGRQVGRDVRVTMSDQPEQAACQAALDAMEAKDREIGRLQAELAELRQALHAINFMQRCNAVVDGGPMMLNVDSPFFDTLVFAEPVSSVTWLNTIKHVKSQRDECLRLLREITKQPETEPSPAGFPREPDASKWQLRWVQIEVWNAAKEQAGGD